MGCPGRCYRAMQDAPLASNGSTRIRDTYDISLCKSAVNRVLSLEPPGGFSRGFSRSLGPSFLVDVDPPTALANRHRRRRRRLSSASQPTLGGETGRWDPRGVRNSRRVTRSEER